MELTELKTAIDAFASSSKAAIADLAAKLAAEKKEREDLELRIARQGTGVSGASSGAVAMERKALATYARTGEGLEELKAMSVGSDPDGGYLVTPVLGSSMITKIRDQSALARLAGREVITVGDGWEEIVDFGEAGATWVGESSGRPATATPQVGKIKIPCEEIYAMATITQRLLDDTAYDLGGWIEAKIADKFGRTAGAAFVSGDGSLKPRGFLDYTKVTTGDAARAFGEIQYFKTGNATGFGSTVSATANPADALINMLYGLRAPYKQGGRVAWVMNSATAGLIRRFKDTAGNYIWSEGLLAGSPPSLLGYEVALDESMPDIGADTFPVAFANWELAYKIVEKPGIRMLRDPYSSKPSVLFYSYARVGGGLANSEAIKLLKCEL
jgi:HK97 family phage major capsid protein